MSQQNIITKKKAKRALRVRLLSINCVPLIAPINVQLDIPCIKDHAIIQYEDRIFQQNDKKRKSNFLTNSFLQLYLDTPPEQLNMVSLRINNFFRNMLKSQSNRMFIKFYFKIIFYNITKISHLVLFKQKHLSNWSNH